MTRRPATLTSPERDKDVPGSIAWFGLAVLVIAVVFGAIDRQIFVLVVEPLKQDLGLGDTQIGALSGLGPALFAAIMGFPLAWLADRVNRSQLLAVCILFWSAATAARGFSSTYFELLLFSTGIAVGEAVLTPVIYSLIPDLFSEKRRPLANFVFFGATVIGVGLGLVLGGTALGATETLRPLLPESLRDLASWRLACLLVAAPGVPIALLVLLIPATRRIQRAVADGAATVPASLAAYFGAHWRAVGAMYAAMGLNAFGFAITGAWLPAAIIRDLNAVPSEVGVRFGLTYTVAAVAGILVAMITVRFWRRLAGRAHVFRALAWALLLASTTLAGLLLATTPGTAYVLAGVMTMLLIAGSAHSPMMLQEISPPQLRARISAIAMAVFVIVGSSGPPIAGAVSEWVGPGKGNLMLVIVLLAAPAILLAGLLYRLIEQPMLRVMEASTPQDADG